MKYCVQERLNWKKWELCVTSNFVFPGALLQIRFVAPVPHPPAKVTTMAVFSSHMSCIQDPQPFTLKPVGLAPRFKANKKKKAFLPALIRASLLSFLSFSSQPASQPTPTHTLPYSPAPTLRNSSKCQAANK